MEPDAEGFLQPVINETLCVHCGLCEQICPVLNPGEVREPLAVYAARAKDVALRLNSSSGGIFSLLAREVIKKGGVAYGAGWKCSEIRVVHKSAENEEQLADLRGSKYVQSDIGDTFFDVKQQLNAGRYVLFSGCPCQVAGLKAFLRKEHPNLICVDLICHSVGSPLVFRRFMEHLSSGNGAVESIVFRDKEIAWDTFFFRVRFRNGEELITRFNETFYARAWWSGLSARRSCFGCRFKKFRSQSDVTIGDAWGIKDFAPEMEDSRGCSVVFVLTKKGGIQEIEAIEQKKITFSDATRHNRSILSSARNEKDRLDTRKACFFKEINRCTNGLTDKSVHWFDPPCLLGQVWRRGLFMLRRVLRT